MIFEGLTAKTAITAAGGLTALGIGGGAVVSEYAGDGNYTLLEISQEEVNKMVDQGILGCEIMDQIQGYLGNNAVKIVQVELNEAGYSRSGPDNLLGTKTCKDIYSFQRDMQITIDGKVGYETVGMFGEDFDLMDYAAFDEEVTSAPVEETGSVSSTEVTAYEDINCKNMSGEPAESGYSYDAIIDIQTALLSAGYGKGGVDGKFLDITCEEVKNFQHANGLKVDGIVGPSTARALGIEYSSLVAAAVKTANEFSPKEDCPAASSCDIDVDLNKQRLTITSQDGEVLWQIPIQSGKTGYETRNVTGKLGYVEYGENNNPERPSIDYPEAILVNPRGYGGGGQKFHGSYSFNSWAVNSPEVGSAGCIRMDNSDSYVFAGMPTGTDVRVHGAKPGTAQK